MISAMVILKAESRRSRISGNGEAAAHDPVLTSSCTPAVARFSGTLRCIAGGSSRTSWGRCPSTTDQHMGVDSGKGYGHDQIWACIPVLHECMALASIFILPAGTPPIVTSEPEWELSDTNILTMSMLGLPPHGALPKNTTGFDGF